MPEYRFDEKGEAYRDSFVDPGPPYDPHDGPPAEWFREVVENAAELVIAFRHDGTITYASPATTYQLGRTPEDLLGTNALELLHPDDLANAADTVYNAVQIEGWRPPRPFRLAHADGRYVTYEVEGLSLFHVPVVQSIVVICRQADEAARVDTILGLLAAHAPLSAILDELVHLLLRPGWHLGVAILYDDDDGEAKVAHTGLPDVLAALDRRGSAGPWAKAMASGTPVYDLGLETLAPDLARRARDEDFHTCWAVPVADPGFDDACVVVWNHELHEPELGQEILLQKLLTLLELALAGRSRAAALERAANTDPLTGLANRRAFEVAVSRAAARGVALLLVDLDGFKEVNDRHGHAAGDQVIRTVADRLAAAVRVGDLAARIGGDEFAILCHGVARPEDVEPVAARLLVAVAEPIPIGESSASVGVSIGGAIPGPAGVGSLDAVDLDRLLHAADEQLYAAKAAGKGCYRLALVDPA